MITKTKDICLSKMKDIKCKIWTHQYAQMYASENMLTIRDLRTFKSLITPIVIEYK